MTWLAQRRKALVALLVPQAPALIAFVTARWGAATAAEAMSVLVALGVHVTPNATPNEVTK